MKLAFWKKPQLSLSQSQSSSAPVLSKTEIEIKQTEALETIGTSLNAISTFITSGGLQDLLSGYARSQSVTAMLGGLTTHAGRNGLDARVLEQNAKEIVKQIESVFDKYQEVLAAKKRGDMLDPDIHQPVEEENEFTKWVREKREGKK